jgi:hypothetical protein
MRVIIFSILLILSVYLFGNDNSMCKEKDGTQFEIGKTYCKEYKESEDPFEEPEIFCLVILDMKKGYIQYRLEWSIHKSSKSCEWMSRWEEKEKFYKNRNKE